jgi:hypothetical protein
LNVAATSADDVWAVGYSESRPLIGHWDGRSWKPVPSADLGDDEGVLFGVAALASDKAWAVGRRHYTPLIEEWDGTSWRVLPQKDRDADTALIDVAAISSNDVWAVGYIASVPLVEHWNGQTIDSLDIPSSHLSRGGTDEGLSDVVAIDGGNVWMTGFRIERWNGLAFQAGPKNGGGNSIAAVSATDIWEVGSAATKRGWKTRVLHYSCK